MKQKLFSLITATIFLMANPMIANAQCCGAGNPISTAQGDAVMKKGQMQIMLGYRHSVSDRYYEGSHSISVDFPGKIEYTGYDFLDFGVSYGITKRLTVGATVGYFIDKKEDYKSDLFPNVKSSGFGDLGLRASYTVYRHIRHGIDISPFIMVKFPVGKFDCESDGIKLPLAMQPSSGSFKYSVGVSASYNINHWLYLTTFDQFEYSQRIKSKFFDYQYGSLWNINLAVRARAMKNLHAGLQFGYENKGKAKNDGLLLDGSEYKLFKLTPQLTGLYKGLQLSAGVDVPVWRKVGGVQMSNSWALQFNLAYNIKL